MCLAAVAGAAQGSAVKDCTTHSAVLGTDKSYTVYLPAGYEAGDRCYPVLYLLHGAWGDHTNWSRIARVKEVADMAIASGTAEPMIIVMPDAAGAENTARNMGYFNQPGWEYEKYFYEELIPGIDSTYRTMADREHRAIAGLSMGGGGSMAYAQRYPEYWGAACSLSGLVGETANHTSKGFTDDFLASVRRNDPTEYVLGADDDALEKLRSVRWYADCGDDDFLYEGNLAFYKAMRGRGVPMEYRMRDGSHTWTYWSTGLPAVLQFVSAGFR